MVGTLDGSRRKAKLSPKWQGRKWRSLRERPSFLSLSLKPKPTKGKAGPGNELCVPLPKASLERSPPRPQGFPPLLGRV